MDKLILHLIDHPDTPNLRVAWRWLADTAASKGKTEGTAQPEAGTTTLDDFARIYREQFAQKEIIAIISGQYLTYTRVAVTVKNQRQMLQALPFLVEEQVIGNIEDMHIATPERIAGDSIRIAIIDKALLEKYRLLFASLGLAVATIFSLPDILPVAANELHMLFHGHLIYVKGGEHCFECDDDSLDAMLDLLKLEGITTVLLSLDEQDKHVQSLANRIRVRLSTEALEVRISPVSSDLLASLLAASPVDFSGSLNILQGEFSSGSPASQALIRYLPVAWMVFLCLCLQIGFNLASGFYFHRYANRIETNLSARYLALFPEESRVVDLGAQLKGKLSESHFAAKNRAFREVFATAISVMNKTGNMKDIHLKQFRYDEDSGELKMGLDLGSVALLDRIKQGLVEMNYVVDIVSANQEGDSIKATLSIKHS
jgi:general secretion pathway protein L